MKANELRIGNLVLTCTPNMEIMIPHLKSEVQALTMFGEALFCHTPQHEGFKMHYNHIMGIELTEEWLMKSGFNNYRGVYRLQLYNSDHFLRGHIVKGALSCALDEYDVIGDRESVSLIRIKYVHQLQNLYFALTGTELEIKE